MDCEATDVRILDVSRRVRGVSFCYQTDAEIAALRVADITQSAAYDDLGRAIPGGLYDPRLGPIAWSDGNCVTCGLTYGTCPGHFGRIALPFPLVHPSLTPRLMKVLRAACWHCGRLRVVGRKKTLLLARLKFVHAGEDESAQFVKVYVFSSLAGSAGRGKGISADAYADEVASGQLLADKVLEGAPTWLREGLDAMEEGERTEKVVDGIVAAAAEEAWKKAEREDRLIETPEGSVEWDLCVRSLIVSDGPTKCPCCMEAGKKITKGPTGTFFFPGKSATSAPSAVIGTIQLAQQLGKVWGLERDIFELVFGLKGRAVRRGSPPLDHEMFFVRNVLVPPSRSRPAAAMVETGLSAEHQQNIFYQRLLTSLDKMLDLKAKAAAAKEGDGESGDSGDEGEGGGGGGGGGGNDNPLAVEAEAEEDSQSEFASVGKAGKSHEYMRIVAEMQKTMNDLYDSPGGDVRVNGGAMGIRQQLETKQGLFRMHMMGKRVNFSCRSVIGPDVFLDTNEVGIPESFAKKLTIAEPVTPLNVAKMQQAVLNGPDVYPGANAVEDWNRSGQLKTVVLRSPANRRQLETQAKLLVRTTRDVGDVGIGVGKTNGHGGGEGNGEAGHHSFSAPAEDGAVLPKRVLRHLKTGDVVLFNRQPTLHRVSIMAHKVRVLPGDKTIRFHYSNCGSYNADFDGDEMNVHVPQDDIARAEAYELMLSDQHYIAPTSGSPIRNLIQDHILAAALISKRGSFFGREEFSALLYGATERVMCGSLFDGERRFSLPTPAILKPQRMWTGKQLISAVLRTISRERTGISVTGLSHVSADLVGREETQVLFRKGEHLRGVLDKKSFGASKFGIVHAVQEAYGAHAAGNFLSAIGRLCTLFIRRHGHTTGVDDLLLVALSESERLKDLTSAVRTIGADAAKDVHKSFAAEDRADGDDGGKSDGEMEDDGAGSAESNLTFEEARSLVSDIVQRKGAIAETRLSAAIVTKLNSLQSVVNTYVPKGLVKNFPRNGFSLMIDTGAKGGAVNSRQISCLLGSTIMEGKRVPRMGGSGSTLPCFAPYDPTPNAGGFIASRFLTGMAPYEMFFHAMAGREGLLDTSLKTANSGYLQRCLVKHLEGIRLHYDYTARDANGMVIQLLYGDDGIDPCKASWLMGDLPWLLENRDALAGAHLDQLNDGAGKCMKPSKAVRSLQKVCRKKGPNSGSTLLEAASPGSLAKFGVVSEDFQAKIEAAQSHLSDRRARSSAEAFCWRRYQKAAAQPGEGVGIIAAHSVGEPSTQMTLNTFHHAGSESKHVTLGVPRLRELLMTASKYPKTPSMTMSLLDGLGEGGARQLSQMFADVSLLDLLEKVVVREGGVSFDGGEFAIHKLTVTLEFPDEKVYSKELGFGFSRILEVMNGKKTNFKTNLMKHFSKELKKLSLDERECLVRIDPDEIDDYTTGISVPQPVPDADSGAKSGNKKEQEALVEAGDSDDDAAGAVKEDSDDDAPDSDMDEHELDDGDAGEIGGTSKENSEAKSKIKVKTKTRRRSTSLVGKVTATASDGADSDDSLALPKSEGYDLLTADESGRKVMIPIELPREVTGRLRVAEIVREAASGLKLASVDRITRCFTEREDKDKKPLKTLNVSTEGSNLTAVLELGDGLVDMNSISTNDMYGILNTYGVEALRAALIAEFKTIFDAYGISVDVRHLSVIADYQCALGGYRSFSRLTMNTAASTMQQFSFETTMKFMTEAALSGRPDPVMTAPSAAVAFGEIYSGGTGSFEVLSQVN